MADITPASIVKIKDLSLPYQILASNAWGIVEPQPATMSLAMTLHNQFSDAEGADNLSNSIDYFALSNYIRDLGQTIDAPPPCKVISAVTTHVLNQSLTNGDVVKDITVELHLPKASMTGAAHKYRWTSVCRSGALVDTRKTFKVLNMNLMALIGVYDFERNARQPLIATLTLDYEGINVVAGTSTFTEEKVHNLEQTFVNTVQESAYETLEALAHRTARRVSEVYTRQGFGRATVNLVFEKPKAIPSAGAAVVEHTVVASM